MQEQKNKRMAALLLALCCITAVIYFTTRAGGSLHVKKDLFKEYDLKSIDQIILESNKGRVELKFNGTRWEVNNKFDADASIIEVLFATLQQVEAKRPLPVSLQDSVSSYLKQNGVKVSVLSGGNTEGEFYCGGNTQKTQTFFYAESGDRKSYLVTIPGYRVYVAGIFELPEKDWKNKYVFGFNWRNFQSLEARFPQKSGDDFHVVSDENYFTVQGLTAIDTAKLNDYLDGVSLLTVDEYVDGSVFSDSLSKPAPFITLTVKDIGRHTYTLALFQPAAGDPRVPGLIDGDQWALFDRRKIQNVNKPKTFFQK